MQTLRKTVTLLEKGADLVILSHPKWSKPFTPTSLLIKCILLQKKCSFSLLLSYHPKFCKRY